MKPRLTAQHRRARSVRGSGRWNGRTGNFGERARSCAKALAHITHAEFEGRTKYIGSVAIPESWGRQGSQPPTESTGSTITVD